ncbi:MAG: fibronectin type III domain-containing protein [bacterium]|nr:fibronectin type III domain-containing protein [bacterium]
MKKLLSIISLIIGVALIAQVGVAQASTDNSRMPHFDPTIDQVTRLKVRHRAAKKVKINWRNVAGADKYQVRVVRSTNKKLIGKKKVDDNKAALKGLKPYRNYDFKVRAQDNGNYGKYSKKRTVKTTNPGEATKLTVTDEGDANVSWVVEGDTPNGVKVVWSLNEHPTYPTAVGDKYKYISGTETTSTALTAFSGDGTYFVRVCEYLANGECGIYSNEIEVALEGSASTVNVISLLAASNGKVNWSTDGTSAMGYKVVWSKNSNPEYPTRSGDKYQYLSDSSANSAILTAFDGAGTYYVRVCEYLGGECGTYSNQVTVQLGEQASDVTSITATAGSEKVTWGVTGYSVNGFKVVWSKNENPTYPLRDGDKYKYFSDPGATSSSLYAFDGAGTYYVRVCEYLGGSCGEYSNQVSLTLQSTE